MVTTRLVRIHFDVDMMVLTPDKERIKSATMPASVAMDFSSSKLNIRIEGSLQLPMFR